MLLIIYMSFGVIMFCLVEFYSTGDSHHVVTAVKMASVLKTQNSKFAVFKKSKILGGSLFLETVITGEY